MRLRGPLQQEEESCAREVDEEEARGRGRGS